MISDKESTAFLSGFVLGIFILSVIIFISVNLWETSTELYRNGYYAAYKQFKQGGLEQSAPKEIMLRYNIEMLKEKYK